MKWKSVRKGTSRRNAFLAKGKLRIDRQNDLQFYGAGSKSQNKVRAGRVPETKWEIYDQIITAHHEHKPNAT